MGIICPLLILLLDFRIGDDASHTPGNKEGGKEKDEDTKSSKIMVSAFVKHVSFHLFKLE